MRLWHYKIIPYLPKSQLVAQWRELNTIYSPKANSKHILIDYVTKKNKMWLLMYSNLVINEMERRNFKINKWDKFQEYFKGFMVLDRKNIELRDWQFIYEEHNDEYLTICYWNLKEKYIRGQKDFTQEVWNKLNSFYQIENGGEKCL